MYDKLKFTPQRKRWTGFITWLPAKVIILIIIIKFFFFFFFLK
jgi:hypothetical protein